MKILMTGATGFVGNHLTRSLLLGGHEIIVLTRDPSQTKQSFPYPVRIFSWKDENLRTIVREVEAIVHLAGSPIADRRWTAAVKEEIIDSRIRGLKTLTELFQSIPDRRLKTIISSSAIGFYGDCKDQEIDETKLRGDGFLADVCTQWEDALFKAELHGVRKAALRTGVVLGLEGGVIKKLLPLFRKGLGGPIGSGKQWMSWIHIDDLISQFRKLIEDENLTGVFNGVSPNPVTNEEFSRALGAALKQPAFLRAPGWALKAGLGEMSQVVLESQKVIPKRFQSLGFQFQLPTLEFALKDLLGDGRDEEFCVDQWIPKPIEEVFSFFSQASNLERITPPWLKFKVLNQSTPKIEQGTLIDYRISLNGIPFRWRTEIDSWNPTESFSDSQLKGPYNKWHHTHRFISLNGGTLMTDEVKFRLPLGKLGDVSAGWHVRKQIRQIFDFRKQQIQLIFG